MKAQILLTQAEDCIDAAIDYLDSQRENLNDHGVTNYVQSVCRTKMAECLGELHKVRRMLPGYERPNKEIPFNDFKFCGMATSHYRHVWTDESDERGPVSFLCEGNIAPSGLGDLRASR